MINLTKTSIKRGPSEAPEDVHLPFLAESPVWLMRKGRTEKAERSLRKIHKSTNNYEATMDMNILEDEVAREMAAEANSTWASLIRDPIERRKVISACGAMISQQINSIQFFYSYGLVFAQSIGISQPFTISLITNLLQVVAVAVSVALGNKVPRRMNLLVTTIMMFCAFIIVGGFGTRKELTTGFSTAIVVFSYIVIIAFNFGLGPLAFAMASEYSAGRNRNKIMSCAIVSFFLTVWVIAFTSPYLY
ncbi:putative glucose transporter [Lachnellula occidentalis]|uniref:Putative glucose transporter n=1 Tax=Lachnellula occidentalis TaxID=215460 RepID=A0A8H8RW45_9HELO|nr:putative glucose transporter [Lachnellula occidentalis]